MHHLMLPFLCTLTLAVNATSANAQHPHQSAPAASAGAASAPTTSPPLSEGEITRWSPGAGKISLRHGPLHNLGMGPMTMAFSLREPQQASALKVGDKVRFRVEQQGGALVITHIEAAR